MFWNKDKTKEEKENLNEVAAFLGYIDYTLKRPIGDKKSVKIKCLPVRMYAEYAAAIEDEPALVEMFTGLSQKEIDSLYVDDFVNILKEGHGLNYLPFSDWLKRKLQAKKMKAKAYGVEIDSDSTQ